MALLVREPAQDTVTYQPDQHRPRTVDEPRLFDTPFRSPRLPPQELSDAEWVKTLPLPGPDRHCKQQTTDGVQAPLFG